LKGIWAVPVIACILIIGTFVLIQEVWAPFTLSPFQLSPITKQLEKIGDKMDRINAGFVSPPDDEKPPLLTELDNIRTEANQIISTVNLMEAKMLPVGPLSVSVTNILKSFQGTLVTINGFGAAVTQTVVIVITSSEGEVIDELRFSSTGIGEFSTIWIVPEDTPPGTYTIIASDPFNSATTTFDLE